MEVSSASNNYSYTVTQRQPVKTLDKDAFLQLFIAQLKNQDPMSPQDSNEFMAQMVQFSILEQITNLSDELAQLKRSQEISEASALLGRQVKVQSGDTVVEGQVEKVAVVDEEVKVYINGKGYGLARVIEVR
ncbi:MAG: flagellar hook capping protein [Peptococcaceae bacterium]|nr:flagellar hook capping protein [Peptococcaceae bacterium]